MLLCELVRREATRETASSLGQVDLDGVARAFAFSTSELLAHLLGQERRGLEGGGLLGRAQRLRIGRRHGRIGSRRDLAQRLGRLAMRHECRVLLIAEELARRSRSLDAFRRHREVRRVVASRKVLVGRDFACHKGGGKKVS